jgi:hypothetical protein
MYLIMTPVQAPVSHPFVHSFDAWQTATSEKSGIIKHTSLLSSSVVVIEPLVLKPAGTTYASLSIGTAGCTDGNGDGRGVGLELAEAEIAVALVRLSGMWGA